MHRIIGAEKAKELAPAKRRYLQALKLYDDQLAEREKYMLKPKGKIAPDGTAAKIYDAMH